MIKERLKEVDVQEEESSFKKKDSVDIIRLKKENEKLNKNLDKLKTTKEDVNYKIEKCKARLSNKKKGRKSSHQRKIE